MILRIEYDKGMWYAMADATGYDSVGEGSTPWLAIKDSLDCIPEVVVQKRQFRKLIDAARAGTARCPGCGTHRPRWTEDTPCWALFCTTCRSE